MSFNPDAGASLRWWVSRRMRGACLDEMRRDDPAPRKVRAAMRVVADTRWALTTVLGRASTVDETAHAAGVTPERVRGLDGDAARFRHALTLDGAVDNGDAWSGTAPDHADAVVAAAAAARAVTAALVVLNARQRRVIEGRYWLGESTTDTAAVLGVTPSRVSQLHTKALQRLRQ